jgi:hypothetical protein
MGHLLGDKKEGDGSMAWVVEKVSSHVLRACSAREDDKKEGTVSVEVDSAGQKLKCSHAFFFWN